jgi:hypothetical protein
MNFLWFTDINSAAAAVTTVFEIWVVNVGMQQS